MTTRTIYVPAWSRLVAERLAESHGEGPHVVVTGISPSGNIHVGNLREVLVAEAVANALRDRGCEVRFVFHADTVDPLRKIAPGVPKNYEEYIGHSLSRIPDPKGCHESYTEHFLVPFEDVLSEMKMDVEVLRSHELYESGFYADVTCEALENTEKLREILQSVSGRKMPDHWSPYTPRGAGGHLTGNRVIEHLPDEHKIIFVDREGSEDVADYAKGEGKLVWRVELAARWKALGATFEPFGKDHTSRGGSTDTADRMAREVFHYPVPGRYEYEWIQLKGKGAMSSSKGIVLLPGELLKIMPPDAVRAFILGRDPGRALDIDLEGGFPRFMDEHRTAVGENPVPYAHLVIVAQTAGGDLESAAQMLRRGGYEESAADRDKLAEELTLALNWAEKWAPEAHRLRILEDIPEAARELTSEQQRYLGEVAGQLGTEMGGDETQALLYSMARKVGLRPKAAFAAVYMALLGQKSGPKAGPFLASLPSDMVRERFQRIASGM